MRHEATRWSLKQGDVQSLRCGANLLWHRLLLEHLLLRLLLEASSGEHLALALLVHQLIHRLRLELRWGIPLRLPVPRVGVLLRRRLLRERLLLWQQPLRVEGSSS